MDWGGSYFFKPQSWLLDPAIEGFLMPLDPSIGMIPDILFGLFTITHFQVLRIDI